MVGISRVVISRRERAVMLEPRGKGIVLWTLRYGQEVRDPEAYFEEEKGKKADAKLMGMIKKIIDERSSNWDPKMVEDPVQDKLLSIIAAKKKKSGKAPAKKPKAEPAPEGTSNVISLMDALKKSLEKPEKKSRTK
jgi:DNA end-binding protein Ku